MRTYLTRSQPSSGCWQRQVAHSSPVRLLPGLVLLSRVLVLLLPGLVQLSRVLVQLSRVLVR